MKTLAHIVVLIIAIGSSATYTTRAQKADYLSAGTVWKGSIHQGTEIFPATIFMQQRDGDRIKGEIHFTADGGSNKLTFQGNLVDENTVVWITDKKQGNVTFPGLYIGKISGKSISGTWQVPSANQYDRFSVRLVE